MNTDVLIIGGGVLGVSLGYHLSVQQVRAIVLEKEDTLAAHASGKNAGMIRQLYRHPQLTDWAQRSIQLWPSKLKKKYFKQTGSVIVGREAPAHHPGLFTQGSITRTAGDNSVEVPAVHTETDGLLDSAGYVQELARLTNKSYVQHRLSEKVVAVRQEPDHWEVQTADGMIYRAKWLVNAAGAWLNTFLEPYCGWLSVHADPMVRHVFEVSGWQKGYMPALPCGFYWDEQLEWYCRLFGDTSRLVSICDRVVADPDSVMESKSMEAVVRDKLSVALPQIASKLIIGRGWHCLRTYTDDQLPIWGEDPDAPGLFWLAAFGGFGMSTSFAAALDAAKAIAGERIDISNDFTPSRAKITSFPQRSSTIL